MIKAIDRGILFIRENPSEARQILRKTLEIPEEVASLCTLADHTLSTETATPAEVEHIQHFLDILADLGEIPKGVNARSLIW